MQARMTMFNMSVCLEVLDVKLNQLIEQFLDNFYTIKQTLYTAKDSNQEAKVFVSKIKNQFTYLFHNKQFIHLYQYLKERDYILKDVEKLDLRDYIVSKEDYVLRPNWKIRPNQQPVFDFLTTDFKQTKLVPLATGSGKTFIALSAVAHIKERLGIIILSQFIEKWVSDITTIHDSVGSDVMVIQGSKSIMSIAEQAKEGNLTHKYYLSWQCCSPL